MMRARKMRLAGLEACFGGEQYIQCFIGIVQSKKKIRNT
jgi:hypothetical protein